MPSFGTVALPDINALADMYASNRASLDNQLLSNTLGSKTQISQNTADTGTQDLTDRATLRGLAPGLSAGNPNAVGQAAVLPNGPGAVGAILPFYNQQSNAAANAAIRKSLLPDTPGAPTPGDGASAAPIGDFQHAMAGRESTDNPTAVNAGGYAGLYQFGAPRLAAIHAYTPAPGEIDENGKWNGQMNGQFHIAGHPEVKTLADFLHNPQAQDAVFQSHVAGIDAAISQTPGADRLDVNGLRAVAHLGGIGGMQQFVATNGAYNPGDNPNAPGGGTHLSDYYQRFAAGGPVALQQAFGHPQGPPQGRQQPAAPGVTLAPDQTAPVPAPVQVAGPGAPTAATGQPTPGTQGVDDVMARLRAGQGTPDPSGGGDPSAIATPPGAATAPPQAAASPTLAPASGHTGPLAGVLPDGPLPPAAANGLAGSGPQPQLMPAASAAPPAGAVQAPTQPLQSGQPQPGQPPAPLVLLPNGLTQQQQTDFINLTRRPTTDPATLTTAIEAARQQNRTAQQQYFANTKPDIDFVKTEDAIVGIDKRTGQVVSQQPVTSAGRITFQPAIDPDTGKAGMMPTQNGQKIGPVIPGTGSDAQAVAYKSDQEDMKTSGQAAATAQANMPRLNEMADLIPLVKSGGLLPEVRAKVSALLESFGYAPDTIRRFDGLSSGSQAQLLTKLTVSTAQNAAKENTGTNTGIQSTQLTMAANPGMHLLPDANLRVTNMMRVQSQATQDYNQAAQQHFSEQEDSHMKGGQYEPMTKFNRTWQEQANPQVYAAATAILNGDKFEDWSSRLKNPADLQRAQQIAQRVDPNITIPQKGGGPISRLAIGQTRPPAVGAVMQGHSFLGGDPSSPASWRPVTQASPGPAAPAPHAPTD